MCLKIRVDAVALLQPPDWYIATAEPDTDAAWAHAQQGEDRGVLGKRVADDYGLEEFALDDVHVQAFRYRPQGILPLGSLAPEMGCP